MIYLIVGRTALLQERAIREVRLKLGNVSIFDGSDLDADRLLTALTNLSIFNSRPSVLVRHAHRIAAHKRDLLDGYIKKIPSGSSLVLVADEIDRRTRFWQTVCKVAEVISAEPPPARELHSWFQRECRERNLKMDREALSAIVQVGMSDFGEALLILDKVELYTDGNVDRNAVHACSSGRLHPGIFEWTDAVGRGDWKKVFSMLESFWGAREEPLMLLALLVRHFRILLKVLENRNLSPRELAGISGVPPFAIDRYIRQALSFRREDLAGWWKNFLDADRSLKSAPGRKEWIVEKLILDLRRGMLGQAVKV